MSTPNPMIQHLCQNETRQNQLHILVPFFCQLDETFLRRLWSLPTSIQLNVNRLLLIDRSLSSDDNPTFVREAVQRWPTLLQNTLFDNNCTHTQACWIWLTHLHHPTGWSALPSLQTLQDMGSWPALDSAFRFLVATFRVDLFNVMFHFTTAYRIRAFHQTPACRPSLLVVLLDWIAICRANYNGFFKGFCVLQAQETRRSSTWVPSKRQVLKAHVRACEAKNIFIL